MAVTLKYLTTIYKCKTAAFALKTNIRDRLLDSLTDNNMYFEILCIIFCFAYIRLQNTLCDQDLETEHTL